MNDHTRDMSVKKETYCEMFGVEPNRVNDDFVKGFFVRHAGEHLEQLKSGYIQMADINAEITHDFSSCEADCERRVLEQY